MFLLEQQQNMSITQECCICRKYIANNEKTVECPDCKTNYHHRHLSLWLRKRKKCPICNNLIENRAIQSDTSMKKISYFNNFNLSHTSLYSNRKKQNSFQQIYQTENIYLFECRYCGNVLNIHVGNRFVHCNACGSSITLNFHLNLKYKGYLHPINLKKKNKKHNHEKISSRKIELQKKERRNLTRTQMQELSQIELQQQIALSLNQEYMKTYAPVEPPRQYNYLPHIDSTNEDEESPLKKQSFFSLIPRILQQFGRFRRRKNTTVFE
ncbi:MAG: RING finger protein, partial [Promethearchaeota archaeon]